MQFIAKMKQPANLIENKTKNWKRIVNSYEGNLLKLHFGSY